MPPATPRIVTFAGHASVGASGVGVGFIGPSHAAASKEATATPIVNDLNIFCWPRRRLAMAACLALAKAGYFFSALSMAVSASGDMMS
jgi:hypothetical protein